MNHLPETEIWSFVAGELGLERERVAAAHLETCTECQQFLNVVTNFRTYARDSARTPSEFESARMTKLLREQVQRQTRVQRQAWLPSKVAAAIAFATLSGAAVAMTASGAWPLFSQPKSTEVMPIRSPSASDLRDFDPAKDIQIAEERALATEIAQPNPAEPAAVETRDLARMRTDDGNGPSVENGDGRVSGSISALSKTAEKAKAKKIAVNEVQPSDQFELSPKAADAKSDAVAKLAMLPVKPSPPAGDGAEERKIDIEPGTPDPLALLQAEEARLVRNDAELGWLSVGDAYIQRADTSRALGAYLQSLAGVEGTKAAQRLQAMVSKGMASENELLEMLADHPRAQKSAEGMRLRCEWRLKHHPDRKAVESCQAFGQAHPAHPAVHRLALAAGLVAENHLQDWTLAVEEYSRALVVSEFAEIPSSDALFFRARARARLGQVPEARADLRLFLHVDSSSWNRKEVDDLMRKLNISRE